MIVIVLKKRKGITSGEMGSSVCIAIKWLYFSFMLLEMDGEEKWPFFYYRSMIILKWFFCFLLFNGFGWLGDLKSPGGIISKVVLWVSFLYFSRTYTGTVLFECCGSKMEQNYNNDKLFLECWFRKTWILTLFVYYLILSSEFSSIWTSVIKSCSRTEIMAISKWPFRMPLTIW